MTVVVDQRAFLAEVSARRPSSTTAVKAQGKSDVLNVKQCRTLIAEWRAAHVSAQPRIVMEVLALYTHWFRLAVLPCE